MHGLARRLSIVASPRKGAKRAWRARRAVRAVGRRYGRGEPYGRSVVGGIDQRGTRRAVLSVNFRWSTGDSHRTAEREPSITQPRFVSGDVLNMENGVQEAAYDSDTHVERSLYHQKLFTKVCWIKS